MAASSIEKIKLACGVPDTDACLAMKQRGFSPRIATDIGAYTATRVLPVEPHLPLPARSR